MKSSTYRQSTSHHMGMSVQGMLNWPKRQWDEATGPDGYITHSEDGRPYTADELRRALEQAKADGKKVLPMSSECEGFDFITGCPGHPETPVAEFGVWMPVECLLPPPGAPLTDSFNVLVATKTWGLFIAWYEHDCQEWHSSMAHFPGLVRDVTAWMPLPEPPQ